MQKMNIGSKADSQSDELGKIAASQVKRWILATCNVFLSVMHVTVVGIITALADAGFVAVVSWLFGNPANHPLIAQYIFSAFQNLSIFGTTALYVIYLAYSLIGEAKRTFKLLKKEES
jgi:hypothetical protein